MNQTEISQRIIAALSGAEITWRTTWAIARQLQLTEESVLQVVRTILFDRVEIAEEPSITGNPLMRLKPAPRYQPSLLCRLFRHEWWLHETDESYKTGVGYRTSVRHIMLPHCNRCGVANPNHGTATLEPITATH